MVLSTVTMLRHQLSIPRSYTAPPTLIVFSLLAVLELSDFSRTSAKNPLKLQKISLAVLTEICVLFEEKSNKIKQNLNLLHT